MLLTLENNCVEPTIVSCNNEFSLTKQEAFVPIVYIMKYNDLNEAIYMNNDVEQGLGSSIFSDNLNEVSEWLGPNGSDCGIVNVNTSTSGAEIGLAFGGNKSTGWGRHAGSDSWKQYMRRSSVAMNYSKSDKVELAQGVLFNNTEELKNKDFENTTFIKTKSDIYGLSSYLNSCINQDNSVSIKRKTKSSKITYKNNQSKKRLFT